MRKVAIAVLAVAIVFGMSMGVMAGNEADVEQIGGDHDGTIVQEGSDNEASILQEHWYGDVGHIGEITQLGDSNFADQWQRGANRDRASIFQEGDDNHAEQDSRGASGTSNPAITEITQLGDDNYAYNYQHSSTWVEAFIIQDGDDNRVDLEQNQADYAAINQLGDDNIVDLEQHTSAFGGERGNGTAFTQDGDNNRLVGVDNLNGELALNSEESAEQRNSTFVGHQVGDDNDIGLYQVNSDALITQDGDGNEALLWQGGDVGHTADIIQDGDGNEAEVIQTSN